MAFLVHLFSLIIISGLWCLCNSTTDRDGTYRDGTNGDGTFSEASISVSHTTCPSCNVSACSKPRLQCGLDGEKMDQCGCCLTCFISKKDDVCKSITCPKMKKCVLNIQGIPMCRCPSRLTCPRRPVRPLKRLCGSDGKTYKNRCAMKVAECPANRKIRLAHHGPCVHTEKDKKIHEKLKEKLAKKTQRKAKKEEKLRRKKLRRKRRKRQQKLEKRAMMMRTGFRVSRRRAARMV